MVSIDYLESFNFANGEPIKYNLKKGGEIVIYPILVKDYPLYEYAKGILDINKNEINDISVIQMSYLQFLIDYVIKRFNENNDELINPQYQLGNIIKLCLKEDYVAFDKDNGKTCILLCEDDGTIKKIISAKEFDDIRKIILHQNDSDYDDRYISQDVREAYEEYCKLKYKNIQNPSLENMKAFVMSKSGYTLKEVNEMPYRIFRLVYNCGVDSDIYIGQKIIQGSYKYDVKQEINHPQFNKKKDPYAEMFSDAESFEKKVQQVNG